MWWLKLLTWGIKYFNLPGSNPWQDSVNRKHVMWGMVSYGRVTSVDPATSQLKCSFADRNFQSLEVQFVHRSCYGAQSYDNPTEGDTAVVLHPANYVERGLVIGFVYTKDNPPPWNNKAWRGILFPDGSYIVYDSDAKNYILNLQGKVTLTTVGDVVANIGGNAQLTVTKDLTAAVTGNFQVQAASNKLIGPTTVQGALTVIGQINHTGSMVTSGTHTDANGVHH